MERTRTGRRWGSTAAVIAGIALLTLCSLDHAANITFGVDLTLTFVQARKQAGAGPAVDPKIPAGAKSELFRAFGSKYGSYTFIKSEVRLAHMSKDEGFEIAPGDTVTVRVTGYKQLWIHFLVTRGGKATAFRISHGGSWALNCGPEPDPVIVVITARKVELQT